MRKRPAREKEESLGLRCATPRGVAQRSPGDSSFDCTNLRHPIKIIVDRHLEPRALHLICFPRRVPEKLAPHPDPIAAPLLSADGDPNRVTLDRKSDECLNGHERLLSLRCEMSFTIVVPARPRGASSDKNFD